MESVCGAPFGPPCYAAGSPLPRSNDRAPCHAAGSKCRVERLKDGGRWLEVLAVKFNGSCLIAFIRVRCVKAWNAVLYELLLHRVKAASINPRKAPRWRCSTSWRGGLCTPSYTSSERSSPGSVRASAAGTGGCGSGRWPRCSCPWPSAFRAVESWGRRRPGGAAAALAGGRTAGRWRSCRCTSACW